MVAKSGGDRAVGVGDAQHADRAQEGRAAGRVHARDDERVPERVKLGPPVVQDPGEVGVQFGGGPGQAVARAVVFRVQLVQEAEDELKKAIARNVPELESRARKNLASVQAKKRTKESIGLWTDDYSNILSTWNR